MKVADDTSRGTLECEWVNDEKVYGKTEYIFFFFFHMTWQLHPVEDSVKGIWIAIAHRTV